MANLGAVGLRMPLANSAAAAGAAIQPGFPPHVTLANIGRRIDPAAGGGALFFRRELRFSLRPGGRWVIPAQPAAVLAFSAPIRLGLRLGGSFVGQAAAVAPPPVMRSRIALGLRFGGRYTYEPPATSAAISALRGGTGISLALGGAYTFEQHPTYSYGDDPAQPPDPQGIQPPDFDPGDMPPLPPGFDDPGGVDADPVPGVGGRFGGVFVSFTENAHDEPEWTQVDAEGGI